MNKIDSSHDIDAFYSSDGNEYLPVLDCSCGFSTGRCPSWSSAGDAFDDHVKEISGR